MKKIILVLFLGVVIFSFSQTNVTIINPKQETLNVTKTIWGVATPDEMVNIVSKFPGRIIKIYKKEGDFVKKGDVLYKLDRELTGMKYKYIEKTSPINGVIVKRSASVGQFVGPSMPLFTIVNQEDISLSISVFPEDINLINNAQEIYIAKDGKKYYGKVSTTIPFGDPMTGMVTVKLKFDNLKLIPYERVEVTIIEKSDKGLVLPVESVLHDNKGYFVYKNINNKAVRQYVKTGLSNDEYIIIKSGINEKDQIISVGANIVKNNSDIKIIK